MSHDIPAVVVLRNGYELNICNAALRYSLKTNDETQALFWAGQIDLGVAHVRQAPTYVTGRFTESHTFPTLLRVILENINLADPMQVYHLLQHRTDWLSFNFPPQNRKFIDEARNRVLISAVQGVSRFPHKNRHLAQLMAASHNPYKLAEFEKEKYGDDEHDRRDVPEMLQDFIDMQKDEVDRWEKDTEYELAQRAVLLMISDSKVYDIIRRPEDTYIDETARFVRLNNFDQFTTTTQSGRFFPKVRQHQQHETAGLPIAMTLLAEMYNSIRYEDRPVLPSGEPDFQSAHNNKNVMLVLLSLMEFVCNSEFTKLNTHCVLMGLLTLVHYGTKSTSQIPGEPTHRPFPQPSPMVEVIGRVESGDANDQVLALFRSAFQNHRFLDPKTFSVSGADKNGVYSPRLQELQLKGIVYRILWKLIRRGTPDHLGYHNDAVIISWRQAFDDLCLKLKDAYTGKFLDQPVDAEQLKEVNIGEHGQINFVNLENAKDDDPVPFRLFLTKHKKRFRELGYEDMVNVIETYQRDQEFNVMRRKGYKILDLHSTEAVKTLRLKRAYIAPIAAQDYTTAEGNGINTVTSFVAWLKKHRIYGLMTEDTPSNVFMPSASGMVNAYPDGQLSFGAERDAFEIVDVINEHTPLNGGGGAREKATVYDTRDDGVEAPLPEGLYDEVQPYIVDAIECYSLTRQVQKMNGQQDPDAEIQRADIFSCAEVFLAMRALTIDRDNVNDILNVQRRGPGSSVIAMDATPAPAQQGQRRGREAGPKLVLPEPEEAPAPKRAEVFKLPEDAVKAKAPAIITPASRATDDRAKLLFPNRRFPNFDPQIVAAEEEHGEEDEEDDPNRASSSSSDKPYDIVRRERKKQGLRGKEGPTTTTYLAGNEADKNNLRRKLKKAGFHPEEKNGKAAADEDLDEEQEPADQFVRPLPVYTGPESGLHLVKKNTVLQIGQKVDDLKAFFRGEDFANLEGTYMARKPVLGRKNIHVTKTWIIKGPYVRVFTNEGNINEYEGDHVAIMRMQMRSIVMSAFQDPKDGISSYYNMISLPKDDVQHLQLFYACCANKSPVPPEQWKYSVQPYQGGEYKIVNQESMKLRPVSDLNDLTDSEKLKILYDRMVYGILFGGEPNLNNILVAGDAKATRKLVSVDFERDRSVLKASAIRDIATWRRSETLLSAFLFDTMETAGYPSFTGVNVKRTILGDSAKLAGKLERLVQAISEKKKNAIDSHAKFVNVFPAASMNIGDKIEAFKRFINKIISLLKTPNESKTDIQEAERLFDALQSYAYTR